jgi:hypothetical protein
LVGLSTEPDGAMYDGVFGRSLGGKFTADAALVHDHNPIAQA